MEVVVLGSAAGGGFPQWNCNAPTSKRAREGSTRAKWRTQASVAVSADGERWVMLNASPDARQQLLQNRCLWPRKGLRDSPVRAVVLTSAEVDHVAGGRRVRARHRGLDERGVDDGLGRSPCIGARAGAGYGDAEKLGCAFAVARDLLGDDEYISGRSSGINGGGNAAGSGFLFDALGNDRYAAGAFGVNGGGGGGVGFLLDGFGTDTYSGTTQGVNGGGQVGLGTLIDVSGGDTFTEAIRHRLAVGLDPEERKKRKKASLDDEV